jgi:hypothetical protein
LAYAIGLLDLRGVAVEIVGEGVDIDARSCERCCAGSSTPPYDRPTHQDVAVRALVRRDYRSAASEPASLRPRLAEFGTVRSVRCGA